MYTMIETVYSTISLTVICALIKHLNYKGKLTLIFLNTNTYNCFLQAD